MDKKEILCELPFLCNYENKLSVVDCMRTALLFSSLSSDVAPPDPIPNSEVKLVSADNT